jgi:glucose-1-phosphate thymidylyltransferase
MGYISRDQLRQLAAPMQKSGYGQYILGLLDDRHGDPGASGP